MADKEYKSVAGFIQFDIDDREVNGEPVKDITIRALGSEGPYIKITVWEALLLELEAQGIELEKGDFIAADGAFEARVVPNKEGVKKTYLNLSAKSLAILKPVFASGTQVVSKKKATKERAF